MLHPLILLLAGSLLMASVTAGVDPAQLQPFSIEHPAGVESPADVSFLLDGPAGKDGFIEVRDGHLARPDGSRFRIWGVNLTGWTRGSAIFPPKDEAAHWADVLARNGINCVRFHFLDMPAHDPDSQAERAAMRQRSEENGRRNSVPPSGLIDPNRDDSRHFDPEALDRLDYFIAELKKRGIYSNLNLNVGRRYKAGDDVPDHELIWVAKGYTYIGERLIELQKEYARKLLTHFNPYTGNRYCDEPAVATVEIVNENSLYEFWFRNWLRGERVPDGPNHQLDFTPFYETKLTRMFNDWLVENRTTAVIEAIRQETGAAAGGLIPRLRRGDFSVASSERFHAEADFYAQVESDFFEMMYSFLKDELGVQSPVIGNADHTYWIPNQPMLRANSLCDFLDAHVYWQHPAAWGKRNTPMVNNPLDSTVIKLSRSAMLGRAFTVSEVNHPNPTDYPGEMIPILAAYAAFQDWDGIYFYTFETKPGGDWDHFVSDYFDITLDPVKMVQMRAGALMFLRADVAPSGEVFARSYSHGQVNEAMRLLESERPYFTPGFPKSLPLRQGSRIETLEGSPTGDFPPEIEPPYISDTGEIAWRVSGAGRGTVTIDSPRSQAMVGFLRDNPVKTRHIEPELKNDFCALTLTSLTDQPVRRSTRLLLTACAAWQNTGSVWNDRRTLWDEWGHGPTLIETVRGWLLLKELDGAVALFLQPLDGAGRPAGEPVKGRRVEPGWEVELGTYPTNHYIIEIVK